MRLIVAVTCDVAMLATLDVSCDPQRAVFSRNIRGCGQELDGKQGNGGQSQQGCEVEARAAVEVV